MAREKTFSWVKKFWGYLLMSGVRIWGCEPLNGRNIWLRKVLLWKSFWNGWQVARNLPWKRHTSAFIE